MGNTHFIKNHNVEYHQRWSKISEDHFVEINLSNVPMALRDNFDKVISERVTKIENIKTDSTKILRPTRQKILRPTVFSSVLLSKKEGE